MVESSIMSGISGLTILLVLSPLPIENECRSRPNCSAWCFMARVAGINYETPECRKAAMWPLNPGVEIPRGTIMKLY